MVRCSVCAGLILISFHSGTSACEECARDNGACFKCGSRALGVSGLVPSAPPMISDHIVPSYSIGFRPGYLGLPVPSGYELPSYPSLSSPPPYPTPASDGPTDASFRAISPTVYPHVSSGTEMQEFRVEAERSRMVYAEPVPLERTPCPHGCGTFLRDDLLKHIRLMHTDLDEMVRSASRSLTEYVACLHSSVLSLLVTL